MICPDGSGSTRVRTLDWTVVSIPNAEFSGPPLENFHARDKIWVHSRLGLRDETSSDQARYRLVEIRKILHSRPTDSPEPHVPSSQPRAEIWQERPGGSLTDAGAG